MNALSPARRDLGKALIHFEAKNGSLERDDKKMDWDYAFFIPKNNTFSKRWTKQENDNDRVLIVTEANRCLLCASCLSAVGDKGATFYEVNGKHYCAKCGPENLPPKKASEIATET